MSIDTSSYNYKPVNPLDVSNKLLEMEKAGLGNKIMRQDIAGREAASRAYKNSLNPLTGERDSVQFSNELANSPEGASKLAEYEKNNAEAERSRVNLYNDRLNLHYNQAKKIASYTQGLVDDPALTDDKVYAVAAKMVSDPDLVVDGKPYFDIAKDIVPPLSAARGDPDKLKQVVTQLHKQQLINAGHLEQVMGQQSNIDTGAGVNLGVYDPVTKQRTNTGMVNRGLAPERREVTVDGRPGLQVLPAVPGEQGPSAQEIANTATGMGVPPITQEELGAPSLSGGINVGGPPPSPTQLPPGFTPTGPKLGTEEFLRGSAPPAMQRLTNAIDTAGQAPARIATYDKILGLLDDGIKTGPTQSWKQSWGAGLTDLLGIQGDEGSKFQQLQKYLGDAIVTSAQSSGFNGSDARLDTLKNARPNDAQFSQTVKSVVGYLRASENAALSKANAMQTFMGADRSPERQEQFEKDWRNAFSQKVFELKAMSEAEQKAYVSKLGKSEAQKLFDKYSALTNLGAF